VRCRTCHSDHDYRNEQPPPPKVDSRKAALFNQVLENVTGLPADSAQEAKAAAAGVPDGEGESATTSKTAVEEAPAAKTKTRKKAKA